MLGWEWETTCCKGGQIRPPQKSRAWGITVPSCIEKSGGPHFCNLGGKGATCLLISYLPTCLKQKVGQITGKSGIFGLKAGHSYKFDKNSKKKIKFSDKLVLKKQDRVKKSGMVANFGPKIRTVPLKAGQLGKYVIWPLIVSKMAVVLHVRLKFTCSLLPVGS